VVPPEAIEHDENDVRQGKYLEKITPQDLLALFEIEAHHRDK
jgi:hypothetical protein